MGYAISATIAMEHTDGFSSHDYSLVEATSSNSLYLQYIADLLHKQWPRGGSKHDYFSKISCDAITDTSEQLPCSYILIDQRNHHEDPDSIKNLVAVGHVRITECFDESSARAVAATYVITEPRNKGYGRILMHLLEELVTKLGYHYIYVWTHTAVEFYRKCGYVPTSKVSLHRPCLKRLETSQVSTLETILASRLSCNDEQSQSAGKRQIQSETIMLPPDFDSQVASDDVWLRKRLVECVALESISTAERMLELKYAVLQYPAYQSWEYYLRLIPWTQQIGPSCGLAALRMVHAAAQEDEFAGAVGPASSTCPPLLEYAIKQGFTQDGELFDVSNLMHLAREVCHLSCRMKSFRVTSSADVLEHLMRKSLIIVAYDSQPVERRPCWNQGRSAHYGVIVGMLVGHKDGKHSSAADALDEYRMTEISDNSDAKGIFTSDSQIVLLVQHGLSKKLATGSWNDFYSSNQQLQQTDRKKYPNSTTMKLSDQLLVIEQKEKGSMCSIIHFV